MGLFDDCRMIKTGLTEEIHEDILASAIGQLSDGIWENSRRMETYWMFLDVGRDDDNEICLKVSKNSYKPASVYINRQCLKNSLYDKTDKEVKKWLADKLKQVVKEEIEENPGPNAVWSRLSNFQCDYLTRDDKRVVHIADAYWVYDRLKERKIYIA